MTRVKTNDETVLFVCLRCRASYEAPRCTALAGTRNEPRRRCAHPALKNSSVCIQHWGT